MKLTKEQWNAGMTEYDLVADRNMRVITIAGIVVVTIMILIIF